MLKPKILTNAKVPMSETGMVTAGMMVARQSCRKIKMTMMTMMTASPMVWTTSLMESPITVVVSTAITPFMPGGKDFFEVGEDGAALFVDIEGVGVGELLNADTDGVAYAEVATGEAEGGIVVFGTDLGAAYVFEHDDAAGVGAVFDDDVFKFARIGEASDYADGHLELLRGVGGLLARAGRRRLRRSARRGRW